MTVAGGMISPIAIDLAVTEWLREDIPSFDVGGSVVGSRPVEATFFVKSKLLIAGFPFAEAVFSRLGCKVAWTVSEGSTIQGSSAARIPIGHVTGPANRVLQGERTALELLTRCSACATYARQCVDAAAKANPRWKGSVAATRKTTPGSFRSVEKYGSIVGGADPHRYSLSSMVMLKDNHIDIAGSITNAVGAARRLAGFSTKIEVECRSLEDALEAAKAGAEVVMLDNFSPTQAAKAIPKIRQICPTVIVELSGGITRETVGSYAIDGVDVVSIGMITHGPPPLDISMKIVAGKKSKL
jgi:nicotinate-nucleotide pyrophosphorylase (carboxylating)